MKKWKLREPVIEYSRDDPVIKKLACVYGVKDVKEFLNPSKKNTHHYSLMKNIDEVVNMILNHANKGHEIVIFADIDADGAFSGAIMYRYLKSLHDKVKIVHKQRDDGHGLNNAEDVIEENTKLLIAIDSSTNDVEACQRIKENGTDIIIIDHHTWEGKDNPYALIVNPQMPDCDYPNKSLSGGMVTFKVCQAFDDYLDKDMAEDMIDLAGLSLLADAMSANEMENRYYISMALKSIKNIGLTTLLNELKIDIKKIDSTKFVYGVSPCVSAITRKNEFEKAIGLYISDDPVECLKLAKDLIKANKERKEVQRDSFLKVSNQINESDKCIVVVDPSIGKGYNGLVAQVITEKYNRPSIVLGHKNEESPSYTGSYRSPDGFSMLDFLSTVKHATFAGGHSGAGGTGCWKNKLENFKKELNEKLKDREFNDDIVYDLEFEIDEVTIDLIEDINTFFRISGSGFKPGKFLVKNLFSLKKESIGNGDTLKIRLCDESKTWFSDNYKELSEDIVGMRFRILDDFAERFPVETSIDIVGTLTVNEFMRYRPVKKLERMNQIIIEDYKENK